MSLLSPCSDAILSAIFSRDLRRSFTVWCVCIARCVRSFYLFSRHSSGRSARLARCPLAPLFFARSASRVFFGITWPHCYPRPCSNHRPHLAHGDFCGKSPAHRAHDDLRDTVVFFRVGCAAVSHCIRGCHFRHCKFDSSASWGPRPVVHLVASSPTFRPLLICFFFLRFRSLSGAVFVSSRIFHLNWLSLR